MESVFDNYLVKFIENLDETDIYNVYKINIYSEIINDNEK
jgi:hypothetical protein